MCYYGVPSEILGNFRFDNEYEIEYEYEFSKWLYCVVDTEFHAVQCFFISLMFKSIYRIAIHDQ